ncbi:MAG: aldolase [Alphaproteobacteria bacterium]|nr:aldolase [Alphaproteobacteria bacterium]
MIAAASGADCIYVDFEHGTASLETAAMLCGSALGAGIAPLVRVPSGAYDMATRMLDAGAAGLLLPHIETAEEAEQAIMRIRFAPEGNRSFGGIGMATRYRPQPQGELIEKLNRNISVLAMIETPTAVENADAIAAVDGIDVLLIGSNDLSIEMGIPGQLKSAEITGAIEKVGQACKAHGKSLGIGGIRNDKEHFQKLIGLGAKFLIIGSDAGYLGLGITGDVKQLRSME